jgi:hypothetical protein
LAALELPEEPSDADEPGRETAEAPSQTEPDGREPAQPASASGSPVDTTFEEGLEFDGEQIPEPDEDWLNGLEAPDPEGELG